MTLLWTTAVLAPLLTVLALALVGLQPSDPAGDRARARLAWVAPWTTLMFVLVFPAGINGFDYVWLVIGIAMDVFSWSGGAYSNRDRMQMYRA